jgi:hypothetical protein
MKQLYRAGGTVDEGFVGQITYTICLDAPYHMLDIEFTFDKQRYCPEDVTPELLEKTAAVVKAEYGLEGTPEQLRRAVLGEMKTEIHTLATLNGAFIGCVHKQLTTRHMLFDGEQVSEGCIPQALFEGVLKVTLLIFSVIKDETHYALTVRAE